MNRFEGKVVIVTGAGSGIGAPGGMKRSHPHPRGWRLTILNPMPSPSMPLWSQIPLTLVIAAFGAWLWVTPSSQVAKTLKKVSGHFGQHEDDDSKH